MSTPPPVTGELVELTRALEKASTTVPPTDASSGTPSSLADSVRALDVLGALLRLEKVTADDLRVTKAGLLVSRLAKNTIDVEVAKKAKELLARWKSQVIPVTPVEVAKANAAKSKSVVEKEKAAAPAPKKEAPKAASDSDSDSSSKKRREKKEKESERDAKKRKTDVVSPALVPQKTVSSSAPLEEQHPHLAQGPFALFRTDDMLRDKMQLMLWTSLGEPPAAALSAGANVDLSAYAVSKMTESPKIVAAAPEASPPPIADAASGETAAAAPVAASPAASPVPSPSPPAPIFRSRVELAYRIEAAMFAKFKDSNSSAYKQKYRDLAPQLRDTNNEELNVSLFLNRLEPTELVSMSVAALAPSSLKAKREKEAAYNREAARCDIGNDSGATDQFLCEKCGLRNCTYFMMQTRGADEPMTIFVTCLSCGNKFRSGDGER